MSKRAYDDSMQEWSAKAQKVGMLYGVLNESSRSASANTSPDAPWIDRSSSGIATKDSPRENTAALLSLIFGILAWTFLPLLGAIIAVIAGHRGRANVQYRYSGRTSSLIGLILGYTQLILVGMLFLKALLS